MATTLLTPILLAAVLDPLSASWVHRTMDFEKDYVLLRDSAVIGTNWKPIVLPDGRLAQLQSCPSYGKAGKSLFVYIERRSPRKGDSIVVAYPVGSIKAGIGGKVVSVAESGKRYVVLIDGTSDPVDMDRREVMLTTRQRNVDHA